MIPLEVLVVDTNDKVLGLEDIEKAHTGRGKHHRAFVTVLSDEKGRVLLQRRKHKLFDGLWDLTAISHPLRINGKTESYQEASDRALRKEMGISKVSVNKVGGFNYFARDGKNCENEFCAVLVGKYDGQIRPNERDVYETRRMKFTQFVKEINSRAKIYTPWAKKAAQILADYFKRGYH